MAASQKTYSEKLKDPRWQKKRLEILQLHNFSCDECKSDKNELHVHHRFYKKGVNPWDYSDDELQCLCKNCHKNREDYLFEIHKIFGQFSTIQLHNILNLVLPTLSYSELSCRNLCCFLANAEDEFKRKYGGDSK